MAEQWLSIVEYARTFGISDMTIRRRIRTGRIQAVLRDGKYYIPTDSDPSTGELRKQTIQSKPSPQTHVVKSHPHAEKTVAAMRPTQHQPQQMQKEQQSHKVHVHAAPVKQWAQLPQNITTMIAADVGISIESKALLDYCNDALESVREKEKLVESRFHAKIEAISEQLKNRDLEIQRLQQQIEDLQLLVQILERKKI